MDPLRGLLLHMNAKTFPPHYVPEPGIPAVVKESAGEVTAFKHWLQEPTAKRINDMTKKHVETRQAERLQELEEKVKILESRLRIQAINKRLADLLPKLFAYVEVIAPEGRAPDFWREAAVLLAEKCLEEHRNGAG
jgi:hypothetical protein